ncbi:MAG: alkaline phosphatase, partial [Candidatus Marinimicrobia bacterium]|nr:alkaline phosphatase [Candidatus Neomarinimicrobiota bacterium]
IKQGMATGLVATSTITHATPAGFAAHVKSRGNYAEIARQLIKADVTVMLGGGRLHFLDTDNGGLQEEDLLAGLHRSGIQVISQIGEQVSSGGRIIGLFAPEALPRAPERKPSTSEMALKALEILEHDPDGFFLMVEESQVDWAGHANDFKYLRDEMRSLNELCGVLLAYQTQHPDVLLVLTADHETGGVSVAFNDQTNDLIPNWGTEHHSGNLVPIFATGPGSAAFDAVADITFVGQTLIEYVNRR